VGTLLANCISPWNNWTEHLYQPNPKTQIQAENVSLSSVACYRAIDGREHIGWTVGILGVLLVGGSFLPFARRTGREAGKNRSLRHRLALFDAPKDAVDRNARPEAALFCRDVFGRRYRFPITRTGVTSGPVVHPAEIVADLTNEDVPPWATSPLLWPS